MEFFLMNTANTSYWKGENLSYVNRSRLQLLHFRPQSQDFIPFPNIVLKGKHHVRHNFKPNFANAMKLRLSFFTFPNDTLVVGRKVSSFISACLFTTKTLQENHNLPPVIRRKLAGIWESVTEGGEASPSHPPLLSTILRILSRSPRFFARRPQIDCLE